MTDGKIQRAKIKCSESLRISFEIQPLLLFIYLKANHSTTSPGLLFSFHVAPRLFLFGLNVEHLGQTLHLFSQSCSLCSQPLLAQILSSKAWYVFVILFGSGEHVCFRFHMILFLSFRSQVKLLIMNVTLIERENQVVRKSAINIRQKCILSLFCCLGIT